MSNWCDWDIDANYYDCDEPVEVSMGLLESVEDPGPEPWEIAAEREDRKKRKKRKDREEEEPLLLVGIGMVWGLAEIGYTPARTCPVCGGVVPRDAVCLVCHRTTRDKTQRPMCNPASVDSTPAVLKGGTG